MPRTMFTRIVWVSAALAAIGCADCTAIQAADDAPKQATGTPTIQDAPWFKKADKDGDGKLSAQSSGAPSCSSRLILIRTDSRLQRSCESTTRRIHRGRRDRMRQKGGGKARATGSRRANPGSGESRRRGEAASGHLERWDADGRRRLSPEEPPAGRKVAGHRVLLPAQAARRKACRLGSGRFSPALDLCAWDSTIAAGVRAKPACCHRDRCRRPAPAERSPSPASRSAGR